MGEFPFSLLLYWNLGPKKSIKVDSETKLSRFRMEFFSHKSGKSTRKLENQSDE
jgi:hypothetical protein